MSKQKGLTTTKNCKNTNTGSDSVTAESSTTASQVRLCVSHCVAVCGVCQCVRVCVCVVRACVRATDVVSSRASFSSSRALQRVKMKEIQLSGRK